VDGHNDLQAVMAALFEGNDGWGLLFFAAGVEVIRLDQSTAIETRQPPGPLGARHAMHEARAIGVAW
jgi:hypothetical protein